MIETLHGYLNYLDNIFWGNFQSHEDMPRKKKPTTQLSVILEESNDFFDFFFACVLGQFSKSHE